MKLAAAAGMARVSPSRGGPRPETKTSADRSRPLLAATLAAAALFSVVSCGTAAKSSSGPASPPAAATSTPTPDPSPTAIHTTPLPVTTPSSSSIYDRTPGVIYEEKGPAPSTPAGATPTHRAPTSGGAGPSPTPTRSPA